jgi:hypothetical protein
MHAALAGALLGAPAGVAPRQHDRGRRARRVQASRGGQ